MLTDEEMSYVLERAYIPEHLPSYMTSFSNLEPFLESPCLYYLRGDDLRIIGYPLEEKDNLEDLVERLVRRIKPRYLTLIAPRIPESYPYRIEEEERDEYYYLNLEGLRPNKKVRNMVRRASRELKVVEGNKVTREHGRIVKDLIGRKEISDMHREMFSKLGSYVRREGVILLEARKDGKLVAFTVGDLSARNCSFYMFSFSSREVPGASDLLLHELIERSKELGIKRMNLGLGVDEGVRRFKLKWGAHILAPFRMVFSVLDPEILNLFGIKL